MIAAFEFLMLLIIAGVSIFIVSAFLLRHQKKNDKLRKKVGALFLEETDNKTNRKD